MTVQMSRSRHILWGFLLSVALIFGLAGVSMAREDYFRSATGNLLPGVAGTEKAVVTAEGALTVYQENGLPAAGYPVFFNDSVIASAPLITDITGDGVLRTVVVSRDSKNVFSLNAVNADGSIFSSVAMPGKTVFYDPVAWRVPGQTARDIVVSADDGTVMDFAYSNGVFVEKDLLALGAPVAVAIAPSNDEMAVSFPHTNVVDVYTFSKNAWVLDHHLTLAAPLAFPVTYSNAGEAFYGVDNSNKLVAIDKKTGANLPGFPVVLSGFALSGPQLADVNVQSVGFEVTVPTVSNLTLVYKVDGTPLGSISTQQGFNLTPVNTPVVQSVVASVGNTASAATVSTGGFTLVSPFGLLRFAPEPQAGPAPKIVVVAQPANLPENTLANGGTYNFGTIDVSSTADITLAIANKGAADLNLSGVPVIGGPDAAEFSIVQNPSLIVAAGATTTMVVRFTPMSIGIKAASVTIASDDPNENPFVVQLVAAADKIIYLYEDAEAGDTKRWNPDNPKGLPSSITNVVDADPAHGHAIQVNVADITLQDYVLWTFDGKHTFPQNTVAKTFKFDIKSLNDVNVYARVLAPNDKPYFLSYSFNDPHAGLVGDRYAYFHLNPSFKDGQWHTITRDLQADLASVAPNVQIVSTTWFYFASTDGRIDNVLLSKEPVVGYQVNGTLLDNNNQPIVGASVSLTPGNGLTVTDKNGAYAFSGVKDGVYKVVPESESYTFNPTSSTVNIAGANETANFVGTRNVTTVYEDAEAGNTARWQVSAQGGQNTITNVVDDQAHGRAIQVANADPYNFDYVLYKKDGLTQWHNTVDKTLQFDIKTTNEAVVHALVTSGGQNYYLLYSFNFPTGFTYGRYISIRLDPALKDGAWHTITRNLEADLQTALPGATITSVENFLFGSTDARVDNVLLTSQGLLHSITGTVTDVGNQPLAGISVALSPGQQIATTDANGKYSFDNLPNGDYTVQAGNQVFIFAPVSTLVTLNNANGVADFVATPNSTFVYEDAEDGTTSRWKVNAPGGMNSITNVVEDQAHGKAIEVVTADPNNYYYTLYNKDGVSNWNNGSARTLQFDLKTSNETYAYARITTDQGQYYLFYSFGFPQTGLVGGRYLSIHLDPALKDGAWHTITRDLSADVSELLPGVLFLTVDNFMLATPGARVDNVLLTNLSVAHTISGVVSKGKNRPIFGAKVLLSPGNKVATTNASGQYFFSSLPDGTYTVSAADNQYLFTPSSAQVVVAGLDMTQNFTAQLNDTFVYEDGEDGLTARWTLNGGGGNNSITNVADDQVHGKTIEIANGDINSNYYTLHNADGVSPWNNSTAKTLQFDLKTSNEVYAYALVTTANQTYYLMYSFAYPTGFTYGRYISIRLDPALKDGAWHTITRDLAADLASVVPGEPITTVDGFLLGSTGARVDNVTLTSKSLTYTISGSVVDENFVPVVGAHLSLSGPVQKTAVTDANGTYTFGSLADGTYTVAGAEPSLVFAPLSARVVIAGANSGANFVATLSNEFVYENGEDGLASRWAPNPQSGQGMSVANVVDDVDHNHVIDLAVSDINSQDYYLLDGKGSASWNNVDAKKVSFDLKTNNETYTYVRVTTAQKSYYLTYSFGYTPGLVFGNYASINLDPALKDGAWHTITRDLQTDLDSITGGTPILSVDQFLVGSTGARIDNVKLLKQ